MLDIDPWSRQAEFFAAVARHHRVAVRSGHKIGKSTGFACLALWWVATRPRARVILTSAGDNQIATILWPELRRLHARAAEALGGTVALDPRTGLRFDDGRVVIGFSTDRPETAAGQSGDELLYLVDEASGIDERIMEAIEGNLAGGGRVALCGNPTQTSGTFYDAFTTKREFWHPVHISSEETPNASGIGEPIPGLATREYVEEKRRQWGEDSPLYAVRVRGDFPTQASNSVVGLELIEAARKRYPDVPDTGPLEIGVDVARFGDDDSVIQPRRGKRAPVPRVIHGQDTVQVAGAVVQVAQELRRPGERVRVKVDVIGVGAGVADTLRQHQWLDVVDVNVAESATATDDGPGYALLRDQLWFAVRDWLRDGGAFAPDEQLEAELVAPVYSFDTRGRIKVESKDSMKKRLKRSPDRADALALAVHEPIVEVSTAALWARSKLGW